jgi:hypothetical protein
MLGEGIMAIADRDSGEMVMVIDLQPILVVSIKWLLLLLPPEEERHNPLLQEQRDDEVKL